MRILTHPAFRDVLMRVLKRFNVPGKNVVKLKVEWIHRRDGRFLGSDKLTIATDKYREFKLFEEETYERRDI
jgi:hypothetical protein